eukprot:SAG11_NODE_864_length_6839_cov_4.807567_3_plen_81_part_00
MFNLERSKSLFWNVLKIVFLPTTSTTKCRYSGSKFSTDPVVQVYLVQVRTDLAVQVCLMQVRTDSAVQVPNTSYRYVPNW